MNFSRPTFRYFHYSSNLFKISREATVLNKILKSSAKVKKANKYPTQSSSAIIPEILGTPYKKQTGNTRVSQRRLTVLNALYLEKITDLFSSKDYHELLNSNGFLVTKVNYATDGSALLVYWTSDSNMVSIKEKLPSISGILRHDLTQLHCGIVPHIDFIIDKSVFKATDVEDLLKIADFGEDYSPAGSSGNNQGEPQDKLSCEDLVKSSDILGVHRDEIFNQIKRSMNHTPKPKQEFSSSTIDKDVQRLFDFKKYLRTIRINQAKVAKRTSREEAAILSSIPTDNGVTDDYEEEWDDNDFISGFDTYDERQEHTSQEH